MDPARRPVLTHPLAGLSLASLLALAACDEPAPRRDPALRSERHVQVEELPDSLEGEEELPPPIADPLPPSPDDATERAVLPAAALDSAYDSDETVEVRRFVYRVQVDVPSVLGEPRGEVETAAAELFIEVGGERVRVDFSGPGWPVLGEVRLRGDSPGAYVFDARGGRPLVPGELASWFEGGPPRAGPILMVRRDPAIRGGADPGPGMLICALLSEWAGESRESVMRRCAAGAPLSFRVGYWRGERMADLAVEVARRELRADQESPPPAIAYASSGTFLEPVALGRLSPRALRPGDAPPEPTETPPEEGLDVVNESDARILVVADGVAIGWVDAGATGHFSGLAIGVHDIAAMRPLGAVVMRPREVTIPGRTVLHAPRRLAE